MVGIYPSAGPVEGGTAVKLGAMDLPRDSTAECVFEGVDGEQPAKIVTSSVAECVAPARTAGAVAVSLMLDGDELVTGNVYFAYAATPQVTEFKPSTGGMSGGVLTVIGANFKTAQDSACLLGSTKRYHARVTSSSTVECELSELGVGNYSVGIVMEGNTHMSAGGEYQVRPLLRVKEVIPSAGSRHGGSLVTIVGNGFEETIATRCQFGVEEVPAEYVSPHNMTCQTPPGLLGVVPVFVRAGGVVSDTAGSF